MSSPLILSQGSWGKAYTYSIISIAGISYCSSHLSQSFHVYSSEVQILYYKITSKVPKPFNYSNAVLHRLFTDGPNLHKYSNDIQLQPHWINIFCKRTLNIKPQFPKPIKKICKCTLMLITWANFFTMRWLGIDQKEPSIRGYNDVVCVHAASDWCLWLFRAWEQIRGDEW